MEFYFEIAESAASNEFSTPSGRCSTPFVRHYYYFNCTKACDTWIFGGLINNCQKHDMMKSVSNISNDDAICLICEADISGNRKKGMEMFLFMRTDLTKKCPVDTCVYVRKCVTPNTYACHVWLNENGQLNLPERHKERKQKTVTRHKG